MCSNLKFLLLICLSCLAVSIDNGLAKTPQMGWNSWNHYNCDINETVIKQTADKMVELGLDKKGYVYVNVDDCWQIARN